MKTSILSLLMLVSFSALAGEAANLNRMRTVALQMAELSRCDKTLVLKEMDTFTDASGNVIVLLAESSEGRKGGDWGVEFVRSVHFNKTDTAHAKAGQTVLTACDNL